MAHISNNKKLPLVRSDLFIKQHFKSPAHCFRFRAASYVTVLRGLVFHDIILIKCTCTLIKGG